MLELDYGGQRYSIPAGELIAGSDPAATVFLPAIEPRHLIILGSPDGAASVRPGSPTAEVLLNGVKLGAEPAPILHGDKLQVGSHELLVTDPRRSGSTQFVSTSDVAKMIGQARPGSAKPATAATGGRLVCLTDGREYTMAAAPMVFGREAGCDIVVPNKDVSRRHAEIMATPQGYVLVDSSTNGTFVNGERIEMQRILTRADVVRVGDHEFRFYADRAPEPPQSAGDAAPLAAAPVEAAVPTPPAPAPPPPAPPPPVPSPPPVASVPPPTSPPPPRERPPITFQPPPPVEAVPPPDGAAHRLSETLHGMPVTSPGAPAVSPSRGPGPLPAPSAPVAAAPSRPSSSTVTLASFLVRSGSLKGNRLQVKVPVVNIGRADYNDIVIPDESVSTMHAKLQRREEIWVLTDNGSTNGTFVDGERISGEAILSPGALIRFGETAVMFDTTDTESEVKKGSGTKVMGAINVPQAPPPVPLVPDHFPPSDPLVPALKPALRRPSVMVSSPRSSGLPSWVIPVLLVIVLAVVAAVLLFK